MIITLEGVDCGGKSTLARTIAEHHGLDHTIIHHQGPPEPGNRDLVRYYEETLIEPAMRLAAASVDQLVILDRWETGELVYGPLLRGRSRLTAGQAYHVDLVLQALRAVRCLAQPADLQVVLDRYDARGGDDLIKRDDLASIHAFYEAHAAANRHWLPISSFITWQNAYDLARISASGTTRLAPYPGYVGSTIPEVVLFGQQRSNYPDLPPANGAWGRMAFTPHGGRGCSGWFLNRLVELQAINPLTRFGLCNAIEPDQDTLAMWRALGQPVAIALGAEAAVELRTLGIPHARVHHPQWAMRFRHGHPTEYVQELREAIEHERARVRDGRCRLPDPAPVGA